MRLIKLIFLFTFLIKCHSIYAQKEKPITLSELIPKLEQQYNIKFNYLESFIKGKKVLLPDDGLINTLKSLEKQTKLRFEILDSQQVLIRKFKPTDLVTICGYIVADGFPKNNIEIENLVTSKSAFTNKDGFFELKEVPFSDVIVFKNETIFLEKKPIAEVFQPECSVIELTEFKEELEEIKITNYLTKGITKQDQKVRISPTNFSVLPGITEPDVMKSLEHIPSVQSPFELPSKIYVRGSTPDQNLVLWNGIKTYHQSHFLGLISAFNPYVIDEIEFYYKGVQAEFGDRLAGVVNMKSSKDVENKLSGGAGLNLINADAFVKLPIIKDKLSTTLAFRRSFTDVIKTPTYQPMADRVFQNLDVNGEVLDSNDKLYFLDVNLSIQAKPNKNNSIQFNAIYAQNTLDFENQTLNLDITDNLITENEGYSLQWQHMYSDRLSQQTLLNFSNYTLDYQTNRISNAFVGEASEFKKNFVSDYGGKTYFNYSFSTNSKLKLGYQFSKNITRYSIENETSTLFIILDEQKKDLKTHSLFTEYQFKITDEFLAQLGFRSNKYSTNEKIFLEPRVYIEVAVFPKFKVNTAATYTSQSISQIQESITNDITLENALWRITDDPLTSQHYSMGSTYKNKGWFIETDAYYKFTDNITTLTAGFLNPTDNTFQRGKSKTLGAELFIKKKFKKYSSWVSYNFAEQRLQFDNINDGEYYLSNLNIEHTFKWQHYFHLDNLQLGLGWLWHSGKATTNVTTNKEEGQPVEVLYSDLNAQNFPVYHKLDFSALYNFKFKSNKDTRYQVGFSIQNLYNKKSILNREFRTTPGLDNELLTLDYYSLAFTPNISLRVFW